MNKILVTTLSILILALAGVFYNYSQTSELAQIGDLVTEDPEPNLLPISTQRTPVAQTALQAVAYNNFLKFFGSVNQDFGLVEPVTGFRQNITKKPFGIFITPETSPVANDKFSGYHTGVDSEFTERTEEIPVRAIADGTVIAATWAKGYGGVVVIKHMVKDVPLFVLYGHLDKASFLTASGARVRAGDRIGVLGDDHSEETDGVRKHLHFAIYTGEKMDYRGYVQTEEELSGWLNPLDLY